MRVLIQNAGPRRAPAAPIERAVWSAVHGEWTAQASRRRRVRRRSWMLAAAIGAVAVGIAWMVARPVAGPNPAIAATFIASRGAVQVVPPPGSALVAGGDQLLAGTHIETGPSAAALLSVAMVGIRIGPDTVADLESPGRVRLTRGRLYADSGPPGQPGRDLLIVTSFGTVAHVGTQFQVQVDPGHSLSVAVREGRVRLVTSGEAQTIRQEQRAMVAPSGVITRATLAPYDPMWSWVSEFVPDFPIEGRALSGFLDWVARETGRRLIFVGAASRADTDHTTLNGSISGLTPMQALDAVLATTRFRYDVSVPGQLRIELQATGDERVRKIATPKSVAETEP